MVDGIYLMKLDIFQVNQTFNPKQHHENPTQQALWAYFSCDLPVRRFSLFQRFLCGDLCLDRRRQQRLG
jgi:hypothetical protein